MVMTLALAWADVEAPWKIEELLSCLGGFHSEDVKPV